MATVTREQVVAFRLGRHGLLERRRGALADALPCPAQEFQRGAALLALGARAADLSRDRYASAVDAGEIVVGHGVRAALHAVAASDAACLGRRLVSADDAELGEQLGEGARRHLTAAGIAPTAALREVADASRAAIDARAPLERTALHDELRRRVRPELLPWCDGCGSNHVSPMLWRYALAAVGARRDAAGRYVACDAGPDAPASDAVRRFLGLYGPSDVDAFGRFAGLARSHARRLWDEVAGELAEVDLAGGGTAWVLACDRPALAAARPGGGVRLLPPGDPFLQAANRDALVPDRALRARLFRPTGSPGAVLADGAVVGLWRARLAGRRLDVTVEAIGRIDRDAVRAEADGLATLRGARDVTLTI